MEWIIREGKQICSGCGYENDLRFTGSGSIVLSRGCPNCSGAITYVGNNVVNVRTGLEFAQVRIEGIR